MDINIPGVEITKKLGEGGMGTVYKGIQISLQRPVAIKVLDPELRKDENFVKRFAQEAKMLATLSHPNIVKGIDFGEVKGIYYFVMEYINARSIAEIVEVAGPLEERMAVSILVQIAKALQHAHSKNLVHRDIKPDNILLAKSGKAKLCDLGLAKWKRAKLNLTSEGTVVGTPYYLSPEQAQGQIDIDIRSDIYSLGATFFYMITGKPPYEGDRESVIHYRHIYDPPPKPTEMRKELSSWLDKFFGAVMAKDLEKRIQTPSALIRIVEKYRKPKSHVTIEIPDKIEKNENSNKKSTPKRSKKETSPRMTTETLPAFKKRKVVKKARKKTAELKQQTPPKQKDMTSSLVVLIVVLLLIIAGLVAAIVFNK